MDIFKIGCLVSCGLALVIIIASFIEHRRNVVEIQQLRKENEKLRKYNRYQQKQIEGLREHNGNLYDENLELKCSAILSNIPDFGDNL